MTDKITKTLRKLTDKEQKILKKLINQIEEGDITGLDVKKLTGSHSIYRVRKGNIRILYHLDKNNKYKLISLERRSDTTYSKF